MLNLLRYPQELVEVEDFKLPEGTTGDYRISAKEMQMARQLIESMAGEWTPSDYRDEFRGRLQAVIEKKMKNTGALAQVDDPEQPQPEDATTNVVDFMSLLKQSIASNKRTPASGDSAGTAAPAAGRTPARARKAAGKKVPVKKAPVKKTPARKAPGKKAPAKKAPARKAATKATKTAGRRKAG
jgi:DNA end-binding protein Ku